LSQNPESPRDQFEVAVLDDITSVRLAWRKKLEGARVHLFSTPEEFWDASKKDPDLLKRLACVITDNDFKGKSETTGIAFSVELRKLFTKPIYLSSNVMHNDPRLQGNVTKQIGKLVLSAAEIKSLLQENV
jgi:hypothetical protein